MGAALGAGSPGRQNLQRQMVTRMAIMSDPAVALVNNPELRRYRSRDIAEQVITGTTEAVTRPVQKPDHRPAGYRDSRRRAGVGRHRDRGTSSCWWWRALVRPMRVLRDGALKVAHTDLDGEIAAVHAGGKRSPSHWRCTPTEEIGPGRAYGRRLPRRPCCWPARKRGCDCWSTKMFEIHVAA